MPGAADPGWSGFAERIYDGLTSRPIQTVGALIIFLIALPLIRAGLRAPPPSQAVSPLPPDKPVPIEIESAWFVQNVTRMQMDIDTIKDRMGVLSNQVAGVAQLIKRQGRAAAKAKRAKKPQTPPTQG
jgi:hypothetical protein